MSTDRTPGALHPQLACACLDLLALVQSAAEDAHRAHAGAANGDPLGPDRAATEAARCVATLAGALTRAIHELLGAELRARAHDEDDEITF